MNLNIVFRLICVFYVSAFFMSCKDPNEVGNSLLKENSNTTFIDTFSIETDVVFYPENLLSNKATSILVGNVTDPNFGNISAKSFFQLRLSEENIPIEENVTVDSVIFYLPYKVNGYLYTKIGATQNGYYPHAQFVGDTTKSHTISVHELSESLTDQDYTVNDAVNYNSTSLGSVTTAHNPTTNLVYSTSEERIIETPTLQIPLNKDLGPRLLDLARNGTQDNFLANFNGFALVGDDKDASIMNFNHIDNNPRMAVYVYYRTANDENYYFRFYVNNDSQNFNQIKSDRSAAMINTLQNTGDKISTSNLNNFGYLQSGTGIQTQFKVPYLKKFIEENPLISIDKAELILQVEEVDATYGYENGPTPTLSLKDVKNNTIVTNDDGETTQIPNDLSIGGTPYYTFSYNPIEQIYTLPLTSYVQQLSLQKEELESLIIAPTLNATRTNLTRFYDNNNSNGDKAMKLRIYYTKVQ